MAWHGMAWCGAVRCGAVRCIAVHGICFKAPLDVPDIAGKRIDIFIFIEEHYYFKE